MNKKGLFLGLSITLSAAVVAVSMFAASTPEHNDVMKLQATPTTHSITYNDFHLDRLDGDNNYWGNISDSGSRIGVHFNGSSQFYDGKTTLDPDFNNSISSNGVTAHEAQGKYTFAGSTFTSIQVTFSVNGSGVLKVNCEAGNLEFTASDETINLNGSSYFTLVPWYYSVTISSITVTYTC